MLKQRLGPALLAQKVFDKIETDNVINLISGLLESQMYETLQKLTLSFDNMYWKQRLNSLKRFGDFIEDFDDSKNIDILEFYSIIMRQRNLIDGKWPKIKQWTSPEIYKEMIGKETVLFQEEVTESHVYCLFRKEKFHIYIDAVFRI